MSSTAPVVDPRTAPQLSAELTTRLRANGLGWSATDPNGAPDQATAALISIAARFGEIVIERLNRAPDKNLLAFLDLLGTSLLPPQPARVPLTFSVAAGSITDAVVPAGTQVAAVLAEGEKTPVVFETERELTALAVTLQTLVAVDAEGDLVADRSVLLAAPVPNGMRAFVADGANEHVLYIAHGAYLSYAQVQTLTLAFEMAPDSPTGADARVLKWEIWDGVKGRAIEPADTTNGLRAATGVVTIANLTEVPEQTVNGIRSRWLRCRLLTPVSPGPAPAQGMVRAEQLPLIAKLTIGAEINRAALVPDVALLNGQALDLSKAFHPFGEQPKVGDTLYLGQREALGQPGGAITVGVELATPAGSFPDLRLKWEAWDGTSWAPLGIARQGSTGGDGSLVDNTMAFTMSGNVTFTLPALLAPTTVNGIESNWIRVYIAAGNYGVDTHYVVDDSKPSGFRIVLATFAPPVVRALTFAYRATKRAVPPDAIVSFNNRQFEDLTGALAAHRMAPFKGFPWQPPALYAAFTLPPARKTFPNRPLSLYHSVRLPVYGETTVPLAPELSIPPAAPAGTTVAHHYTLTNTGTEAVTFDLVTLGGAWASTVAPSSPTVLAGHTTDITVSVSVPTAANLPGPNASDRGFLMLRRVSDGAVGAVRFETRVGEVAPRRRELRYEYWNGSAWAKLAATDGTDRLTRPGVIEFVGPADFALSRQFGVDGYWIRALLDTADEPPVQLRALLPNTTFAMQAVTVRLEVLGSSDASANQLFRTVRTPVLAGPVLEVREPSAPSAEEIAALATPGVTVVAPLTGSSSEVWVRWTEVADFHGSTPQDRHYVLDHLAGEVHFGDGVQGRIPPRGVGSIRMARYRTGGGDAGNRRPGTVVQLKTTVPYIEKVTNLEAAEGGAAAESTAALLTRAPRSLRHGGRAVTVEDHEDLARAASSAVARARAVPVRQLRDDPLGKARVPGAVSIVIVPQSADAKPLPSSGLMTLVEEHVRGVSTATAELVVVGPLYVRVDVSIDVALASFEGALEVETAVGDALRRFLHPLTGGRDGAGWDFGRQPHLSDLYALISDVPGVDHVRRLTVDTVEELPGALESGRFLVYSGQHHITLTFLGDQ